MSRHGAHFAEVFYGNEEPLFTMGLSASWGLCLASVARESI